MAVDQLLLAVPFLGALLYCFFLLAKNGFKDPILGSLIEGDEVGFVVFRSEQLLAHGLLDSATDELKEGLAKHPNSKFLKSRLEELEEGCKRYEKLTFRTKMSYSTMLWANLFLAAGLVYNLFSVFELELSDSFFVFLTTLLLYCVLGVIAWLHVFVVLWLLTIRIFFSSNLIAAEIQARRSMRTYPNGRFYYWFRSSIFERKVA